MAATALVAGGVAQVTWQQVRADAAASADAAAVRAEQENRARGVQASSARLTGQATAYLAQRRTEALTFAEQAVEAAGEVDTFSASLLAQGELDTLSGAIDAVKSLLETTPDAQTAIIEASQAAVPTVDEALAPDPQLLPVTPYGDAIEMLQAPAADPTPSPTADVRAVTVGEDPGAASTVPEAPSAAVAGLAAQQLTLDDSSAIVDAAQLVLDLSAQVQIALSQALADRAAALAAADAADELARALAVEAGKTVDDVVEAAKNSPNGAIPEEYLCGVNFQQNVLLRCDAAAALEELNAAYRADTGHSLGVSSSYRTAEVQAQLRAEKGELAAAPGTSNHGWGLAVDLAGAGSLGQYTAPLYLWLTANAGTYGWHHPHYMELGGSGPPEPWHWEFDTGT